MPKRICYKTTICIEFEPAQEISGDFSTRQYEIIDAAHAMSDNIETLIKENDPRVKIIELSPDYEECYCQEL